MQNTSQIKMFGAILRNLNRRMSSFVIYDHGREIVSEFAVRQAGVGRTPTVLGPVRGAAFARAGLVAVVVRVVGAEHDRDNVPLVGSERFELRAQPEKGNHDK